MILGSPKWKRSRRPCSMGSASAGRARERIGGRSYGPGEGIGDYADHVRAAGALLTAYETTGRLPYAMLAEELMQSSKRTSASNRPYVIECEAARVLCRLAALHDD